MTSYASFPNPDANLSAWTEVRPTAIYDSVQLKAGETVAMAEYFFSVPVGELDVRTNRVRTVADTNMWRAQRLPPPCALVLRRLELLFCGDADEIRRVISNVGGDFEFVLRERVIIRLPLVAIGSVGSVVPQGVVPGSGVLDDGSVEFTIAVQEGLGLSMAANLASFSHPSIMPAFDSNVSFHGRLAFQGPVRFSSAVRLVCLLIGDGQFAVQ